jgi:poly-gamma-glutamate capsule biosynthesis protein CapA/YwtB (metallophosphatase superfamily)
VASGNLKMVMVGDVYVQRDDPHSAFEANLALLQDADITYGNLETVIADPEYLEPSDRDHHPRSDERVIAAYLRAGFNVLHVANNPSMHHGRKVFMRSMEVLDRAGILRGGGGRNLAEARKPVVIERNGLKVAFVCRTAVCPPEAAATDERPGVARFKVTTAYQPPNRIFEVPGSPAIVHTFPDHADKAAFLEDLRDARQQADLVVASWHWGVSRASGGQGGLVGYQIEMAHASIDAGADMVVGHHPHVLQPVEFYKGKPIVYSLGNYIHDMASMGRHKFLTALLRCQVRDGKIVGLAFVPGRIDGCGPPVFYHPKDASDVIEHVASLCTPFGTALEIDREQVVIRDGSARL